MHPRAVVVIGFAAVKQIARAEFLRNAEHAALIAKHAAFHRDKILRQRFVKIQMGRAGRTVIADVRVIRTFLVIHPLHKFRDDGVHVRVTFAVRVRRQVERHVVEINGEVGAVIEIEAAQEILVGLAAAGVLGDDDAGNGFQDFPARRMRALCNFRRAHRSLRGGSGDADHAVLPSGDDHRWQARDVAHSRRAVRPCGRAVGGILLREGPRAVDEGDDREQTSENERTNPVFS